jgi:REP element-mobilizing transposase RayT
MANTYTQIYVQYIFAVQNRNCIIKNSWSSKLYKYITGIVKEQGNRLFSINGMPDHLHVLVSMSPKQSASDLMFHIKRSTSLWINKSSFVKSKFSWQEGFGAFSYGKTQIPDVVRYIESQLDHHRKRSFYDEYLDFLNLYDVEYDERYVFKPTDYVY